MTIADSGTDRAAVAAVVVAALAAAAGLAADQIETSQRLTRIPGVESVTILRAVVRIEDRYGINVPDDFIFETATVADLIDLVAGIVGGPR